MYARGLALLYTTRFEQFLRGARAAKRAFDVNVENLIPDRVGQTFEIGKLHPVRHAGIVDDDVDRPQIRGDLRTAVLASVVIRDVPFVGGNARPLGELARPFVIAGSGTFFDIQISGPTIYRSELKVFSNDTPAPRCL